MKKHEMNKQKKSVMSMGLLVLLGSVSVQAMDINFEREEREQKSYDFSVQNPFNGLGNYVNSWFAKDHVSAVEEVSVAKVENIKPETASTSWMPNISIQTIMKNQKVLTGLGIVGVVVVSGTVYVLYKKGVFNKAIKGIKNNKFASGLVGSFVAGAIAVAVKIAMTQPEEKVAKVAAPAPSVA